MGLGCITRRQRNPLLSGRTSLVWPQTKKKKSKHPFRVHKVIKYVKYTLEKIRSWQIPSICPGPHKDNQFRSIGSITFINSDIDDILTMQMESSVSGICFHTSFFLTFYPCLLLSMTDLTSSDVNPSALIHVKVARCTPRVLTNHRLV